MSAPCCVTIGAPRWARLRVLAWVARVLGLDKGWTARGNNQAELGSDLERLAPLHDCTVEIERDPWTVTITSSVGGAVVVS